MRSSRAFFSTDAEEAARHMTADCLIEKLVEDWTRLEEALGCAEDLLHHGELLDKGENMASGGPRSVLVRSTKTPSNHGVLLGLASVVDDEAVLAGGRQEAAISAIADQRLVAASSIAIPARRESRHGRGDGIFLGLIVTAADDVAPTSERHRFLRLG